jgi:hypothetical protein
MTKTFFPSGKVWILLTNQTSAEKGFFPPKGMPNKLRSIGKFSVLSVC